MIIFSISQMLSFWSKLLVGAKVLLAVASEIFNKNNGWGPVIRRLE
jgi:hypothetical protein